MNSQLIPTSTAVNNHNHPATYSSASTPLAYATILNSNSSGLATTTNNNVLTTTSIINGNRQQQYHRPLLRGVDENSHNYDGKENRRK